MSDKSRQLSLGWRLLGVAAFVGLVGAILWQLRGAASDAMTMIVRLPPLVWPALALLYMVQPLCEFVVFRRLWNMPVAGFEALLRKNVINEVVLGYSGEAYLYVWARRAAGAVVAPFQAIKDVNILSALLGNLLTVALALVSATHLRDLELDKRLGPALWSGLIPVAISLGLLVFGRRVFSLPRDQLVFVGAVHAFRLIVVTGLTVLIWWMALPQVAISLWIVFLTIRYLVSRIPFISNKELVFGNLMLLVLGPHAPVAVLLAALALITLFLHLAVIVGLGALGLARGVWRARGEIAPVAAEAVHD